MASTSNQTAYIYTRSATQGQAGSASGLDTQERECRDYAAKRGYTVVGLYSDAGLSGTSMDRPGWNALLSAVQAGGVGSIIATTPDRVSRDPAQLRETLVTMLRSGVAVEFVTLQACRTSDDVMTALDVFGPAGSRGAGE